MRDKKILQQYVEGNASKKEIKTVIDWLDADKANVREFMALHKLNDITILNKSDLQQKHTLSTNKSQTRYRKIVYEWLKITAICILCWTGFRFIYQVEKQAPSSTAYQTLFIPAGQRAELLLPDSTKVWLNAQTKLVYPTDFGKGERIVMLDGEAYFDVKRNEKNPFIVRTEKMDIKVLGTEFNINAYSKLSTLHIALLKGAIDLRAPNMSPDYSMKANEQAGLENGKLNVTKISDYDYFKWKDGLLCFNNETVASIIEKLQLYFDVQINVNQTELLTHHYTGKFRTKDGIEQVLKVLQLEHRFTYTRNNELNSITIQ